MQLSIKCSGFFCFVLLLFFVYMAWKEKEKKRGGGGMNMLMLRVGVTPPVSCWSVPIVPITSESHMIG